MRIWGLIALVVAGALAASLARKGDAQATGIEPLAGPTLDRAAPAPAAAAPAPSRLRYRAVPASPALPSCGLQVTDGIDGRPLSGVELKVGTDRGTVHAETDAKGSASLPPSSNWVLAAKQGYRRKRLDLDPSKRSWRLELTPAARLTVRVLDSKGAGIPGIQVDSATAGPGAVVTSFGVTDAKGFVSRNNLPQGARIQISASGRTQEIYMAPRVAAHECTFELPASATLVGHVVDGSGCGLADHLVSAQPDHPGEEELVCRTAADGGFRLRGVPPGGVLLNVPGTHCAPVRVFVTSLTEFTAPDLLVPPKALAQGRVRCSRPAQASGLEVSLWRGSQRMALGMTDSAGRFSLEGAAGDVRIRATYPGSARLLIDQPIHLPQVELELSLETAPELVVHVQNGEPGTPLECLLLGGTLRSPVVLGRLSRILLEGQLALPRLPQAKWVCLSAGPPLGAFGALPQGAAEITLALGSTALELEPELVRQGAAQLTLKSAVGDRQTLDLDSGSIGKRFLPGPTRWHALSADRVPLASGSVVLHTGTSTVLTRGGVPCSLVGRLPAQQGRTLARLSWLDGMAYMEAEVSPSGDFGFHDLPAGRYSLGLPPQGFIRVDLQPGEVRTLELPQPRYSPITVYENGQPVEGLQQASVFVSRDKGRTASEFGIGVQRSTIEAPVLQTGALILVMLHDGQESRHAFAWLAPQALEPAEILHLGTESVYVREPTALSRAPTLRFRGLEGISWPASIAPTIPLRWSGERWEFSGLPPGSTIEVGPASLEALGTRHLEIF